MIPNYLSAIGAAVPPALGNHLWQSTLCIVIAGLLTLVLRKNRARARYGIWLAASIKFLIPFSLLIAVGSHLARPRVVPAAEPDFFLAMEEFSQPFSQASTGLQTAEKSRPDPWGRYQVVQVLPEILMATWFCGFAVVLLVWFAQWRRISAALREASPIREGREVEALRRLQRVGGIRKPIALWLSPDTLEPGIFGIFKPVLVWPEGISKNLQDTHLEAIIAHEVWHVRRRDNLAAAVHMIVEAIFWFHPLVWWLTSRLVEERELACDEAVLELGSERQVYAESILKTCEFCVESPLACMSGVTGSDLKKRIVRIMTERLGHKLSLSRKLLLTAFAIAVIAGPVVFGLVNAAQTRAQAALTADAPLPSFEVASIKPNRPGAGGSLLKTPSGRFVALNVTPKLLIEYAYEMRDLQVSGGPSWINSERYDINAKMGDAPASLQTLNPDHPPEELRLKLQVLLADRFALKLSHQTKELPVYALIISKTGPKLHEATVPELDLTNPNSPAPQAQATPNHILRSGPDRITAKGAPISSLAAALAGRVGRIVLDETGLKGTFDFTLRWTPDQPPAATPTGPAGRNPSIDSAPPPDNSGPSLFTAPQEQLGLKLESTKGPVDTIVIEHIERPSEN
jgi:bla regulator protein blaR1